MKKKILIIFSSVVLVLIAFALIYNFVLFPIKFDNYVLVYAKKYDLEQELVYAVIKAESDFDENAVSSSGAMGLMQIMPTTASWIASALGENFQEDILFNPKTNIRYGCFYLSYLFSKFKKTDIVIAAYNAGEGTVKNWIDEKGNLDRKKIDYKETENYLIKVERFYKAYKKDLFF